VTASGECTPIAGAEVDFWSADSSGDYSGYSEFGTQGQDWLRGQQLTDQDGIARVQSIVPGSYPGRAVHVHVKVRSPGRPELTTQVYLPDDVVATVLARPDYDGGAQTLNGADSFYADDTLTEVTGDVDSGYVATIVLVV
ncbi:MAG: twin-arginine translocation pathway signal protein, partial [Deltaproteobacteria bacterium]|nr:twin-arginine translocation pathway signal protein [Deltaproteobacteria bacterium]